MLFQVNGFYSTVSKCILPSLLGLFVETMFLLHLYCAPKINFFFAFFALKVV